MAIEKSTKDSINSAWTNKLQFWFTGDLRPSPLIKKPY